MSYEKVKSIKIDEKDNKVWINGTANNIRPLDYHYWECTSLSNILKEKGRDAVDIEILKTYEEGSFQGGSNKYTKALKVLRYIFGGEYKKFNWRNHNAKYGTPEREEEENLRKSKEFDELLKKCLNYKFPKEKYVITKKDRWSGDKVFGKSCKTCMKWSRFKEKATKFDFEKEARNHIFEAYKDSWEVEKY